LFATVVCFGDDGDDDDYRYTYTNACWQQLSLGGVGGAATAAADDALADAAFMLFCFGAGEGLSSFAAAATAATAEAAAADGSGSGGAVGAVGVQDRYR
jgi:hypothetical protein